MDLLSADLMPGCFPSEFPIRSNFKLQSNLRQYRVGLFLVVIEESFSEFNRIKMVGRVEGFTYKVILVRFNWELRSCHSLILFVFSIFSNDGFQALVVQG